MYTLFSLLVHACMHVLKHPCMHMFMHMGLRRFMVVHSGFVVCKTDIIEDSHVTIMNNAKKWDCQKSLHMYHIIKIHLFRRNPAGLKEKQQLTNKQRIGMNHDRNQSTHIKKKGTQQQS